MKNEASALREARTHTEGVDSFNGKGKEREREASVVSSAFSDDSSSEDRGLPRTPAGKEHRSKRGALRNRLRECRLVLHRVKFLQGDVYHVLGDSHSPLENDAYGAAEVIRRELLKSMSAVNFPTFMG